jgi:hypothetical protein
MKSNSIIIEKTNLEELVNQFTAIIKKAINDNAVVNDNESDRVLTRSETSELLQVSYVTLNKWNKLGILPAFSVGNRVYYKWTDVLKSMKRVA